MHHIGVDRYFIAHYLRACIACHISSIRAKKQSYPYRTRGIARTAQYD